MGGLSDLRKQLAEVTDCNCRVEDDTLVRCESHEAAYEAGRRLAHLPD